MLPGFTGIGSLLWRELHRLQAMRTEQRSVCGEYIREIAQRHEPGSNGLSAVWT